MFKSQKSAISIFSHPRWVSSGEQLGEWYGEDLTDHGETDIVAGKSQYSVTFSLSTFEKI